MYKIIDKRSADTKPKKYLIGDVSLKVNLSQKTIREYEKIGLIKPQREPRTNNRLYSNFEIEQIRHITRLIHEEGFTLPCIRRILELAPCWNVFDCDAKERCPAYQYAPNPCYDTRMTRETICIGTCDECVIFLNRPRKKERLLKGPGGGHYKMQQQDGS